MNRLELLNLAYRREEKLHVNNPDYVKWLLHFTIEAAKEDSGKAGDITAHSVLKKNNRIKAGITAKQNGIAAGIEEAAWFYGRCGIKANAKKKDGDKVKPGDIIMELEGPEFALLETERTGLNLLQRMSGIATLTNEVAKKAKPMMVAATRKTHWGNLDNKAVAVGGGATHRLALWESIIIKENHLEALSMEGDFDVIEEALNRAWANRDRAIFIEIEVKNINETIKAAKTFVSLLDKGDEEKPCIIMLDNFSVRDVRRAVDALKEKGYHDHVLVEASGGITPENVVGYRDAGADVVSLGYLTHSPKALDISQLIVR